jgi:cold shock CspA family protein
MTGEVKFYLVMDGYGFIQGEDKVEYFVHKTQVPGKKLIKGERVEFEVGQYKSRTVAKNVRVGDGGGQ